MTYRFLKLTTSYPQYVNQFIERNPILSTLPYEESFNLFANDYFYSRTAEYLKKMGNETQTYNVSIKPLQEKWAQENNIQYTPKNWLREIVFQQIKKFDPEVIYLEDLYLFDKKFRVKIREKCNRKVYFVGWRSAPTPDFSIFADMDLMLSADPLFVQLMRKINITAYHLPWGFEKSVLSRVPELPRDIDFSFIGSIGYKNGAFKNRYGNLTHLLKTTPLEIWGDYCTNPLLCNRFCFNQYSKKVISLLNKIPILNSSLFKQTTCTGRIHKPVFGKDYITVLARSKMTFNCHIDCSEKYAGNIRLFEATGMGTCLITDWKQNIQDFFDLDTEIITYRNVEECVEKVQYYLKNDGEREAIAKAGQRRTLKDHTMEHRMEKLNEIINELQS